MSGDGIGGTDGGGPKVVPLFGEEASAAGLPPQHDLVEFLAELLEKAREGEIVGLIYVGMDHQGNYANGTRGRVVYTAAVASLEELKLSIISHNVHAIVVKPKK